MSSSINTNQLICRTCLKVYTDTNMHHIFEPYKYNILLTISDILMDCTSLKIKNDHLPVNICNTCLEILNSIYRFRGMVIESDKKLRNSYSYKTKEFLCGDGPDISGIKEENFDGACNISNEAENMEHGISHTDNIGFVSTENRQSEQSSEDYRNVDESVVVKEEICDNDVEMFDACDDNSLSSHSFISSASHNDFSKEKEENCTGELSKCQTTAEVPSLQTIEKQLDEEEFKNPLKSVDLSEYEHMKKTLNYIEKRSAKIMCKLCKKSCKYKYFLVHMRRHVGDLPHKCDICNKSFVTAHTLICHKKTHTDSKLFICDKCSKSFKTIGSLSSHQLVHTNETPFSCNICNKQFKNKSALTAHSFRHGTQRKCVCELCGKSCADVGSLRNHLKTHVSGSNHSCPQCNKSFKLESLLKTHLKRHSDERPYICHICNKGFKDKAVLECHYAIHSEEKRHSCKVCGKMFRQASCLPRHMRIHTGETPFACEECPAVFKYSHHLKNHMKVHS